MPYYYYALGFSTELAYMFLIWEDTCCVRSIVLLKKYQTLKKKSNPSIIALFNAFTIELTLKHLNGNNTLIHLLNPDTIIPHDEKGWKMCGKYAVTGFVSKIDVIDWISNHENCVAVDFVPQPVSENDGGQNIQVLHTVGKPDLAVHGDYSVLSLGETNILIQPQNPTKDN